ncbi:cytidine deaminase-like protein [Desarmillaria ectypa]|nr:cytidine deaminase-like protein [Desarmillaria ectypa]
MTLTFDTPSAMLDYVTRNWRTRFVTVDLCTREHIERFIKRPFFMLLSVDAPILDRYRRSRSQSLEDFVRADDEHVFGQGIQDSKKSLKGMNDLVHIKIINDFRSVSALYSHLNDLNLLDPCHLRPDWDTYFMTLASLAAERSNCMKRRVGAILVRDNRILSTGYNGTPRHLLNCNEGGCSHCNGTTVLSDDTDHCICLHAEENALLEAGRERVGVGSVLYCNTCPCLKCTIKIIQTGVTAVVYNLSYKVDAASAQLFKQAGVQLRRHHLPGQDGHPFDPNGIEQK